MVEIVSQPYNKTYLFSIFSPTFLTRLALILITIAAPFFIVYNSGNFYQNNKTTFINLSAINLKPTYQYYITLKTSTQSYAYTNFYINQAYQAITIKFTQKQTDSLNIVVEYPKLLAQKVKQIDIFVGFQYLNYKKSSFGLIRANVKGYDLGQVASTGFIQFKDGTGSSLILKSQDILRSNQFNFLSVYEQFYQSTSYMTYKYNSVPISLPNDCFKFKMVVNYPDVKMQQNKPSILGQLVWSWIQYFPIMFVIYLVTDFVWLFLLREGLVKRTVKHDKQYLQILRKQQDRRNNSLPSNS